MSSSGFDRSLLIPPEQLKEGLGLKTDKEHLLFKSARLSSGSLTEVNLERI